MPLDTIDPSKRIFLSVEEVAQLFGLSKKTVYRLLDRGLLKSSNAVRHKMILRTSVDEFVAKTVNNG
ncbi:MAG: DNA-binding protein [Verrucomicrobia bacterium]|nr:DNA-binding protein [Verrucomicrobiota bacterium]